MASKKAKAAPVESTNEAPPVVEQKAPAKKAAPEVEQVDENDGLTHPPLPDTSQNVRMVRDATDAKGNPVSPTEADVHPTNIQSYLDADVGWRLED